MKLRSTINTVTATAVLAAFLALPATAASAADPTPSATPSATASAPGTDTPTPTDSATATASPTATDSTSATAAPSATDSAAPSASPTDTPSASASASATAVPSVTPTATATATPTVPTATSAPDTPTASSGMNSYGNRRRVQIWAWDQGSTPTTTSTTTHITSVVVHYYLHGAAAGTPEAAEESDFTSDGGPWVAQQDAQLPQLGLYDLTAELTDSAGNHVLVPNAGQFQYYAEATVTSRTASPAAVNLDHNTVTLTGMLSLVDPRDNSRLDPAGLTLDFQDQYVQSTTYVSPDAKGTVDSTGQYTASVQVRGETQYRAISSGATAGTTPVVFVGDTAPTSTVTAIMNPTRIRILSGTELYAAQGGSATITGVIEHWSGGSWHGAGQNTIYYTGGGYTSGQITAGSDGVFRLTTSTAGSYYFDNFWDYNPFLASTETTTPVNVHIPVPTAISNFTATEDEYGEAVLSGNLTSNGQQVWTNRWVSVEYSGDNKHWSYIGSTQMGRSGLQGGQFFTYAYNGTTRGYWRVHFWGTGDYSQSWSKSVAVFRFNTRITGGRPSNAHPYRNQTEYFSGYLQDYRAGSWQNMGNTTVGLYFRPTGSRTWYWMAQGRTDSKGRYSLSAKDPAGGTWCVAFFTGSKWYVDADGPAVWVGLR